MKNRLLAFALMLALIILFFTACGGDEDTFSLASGLSPSISPSSSHSATMRTIVTPTPSSTEPVETMTPEDVNLGDTFAELAKQSNLVVRGKFVKKLKEPYNAVRDANEPEKPDPKEKMMEWQYTFEVTEVYKTPQKAPVKAGDKITVNIAYENNNYGTGYKTKKLDSFFEPDIDGDTVLFLMQNTLDTSIYYPDAMPFYFQLKGDLLYAKSNSKTEIDKFNAGMKIKDGDGIPLANLKKDLNVK